MNMLRPNYFPNVDLMLDQRLWRWPSVKRCREFYLNMKENPLALLYQIWFQLYTIYKMNSQLTFTNPEKWLLSYLLWCVICCRTMGEKVIEFTSTRNSGVIYLIYP